MSLDCLTCEEVNNYTQEELQTFFLCKLFNGSSAGNTTITWVNDLTGNGGAKVLTAQQIIDLAVIQLAKFADGSSVVATDVIQRIDVDLQPIGALTREWTGAAFADVTTTASGAVFIDNIGESHMNAGGSRSSGDNEIFQKCAFTQVEIDLDAAVVVSVKILKVPL
ncbi:MAG: hypothetical protein V3W20_10590 [Candidatus Neomarinimicrobiota bacterium]